jgi:hypothetical protein
MERFLLSDTAMKRKVIVRTDSWLAKIAARRLGYEQVAIVFGHTIHLHNTSLAAFFASRSWLCHELKHVEQYERLGTLLFLVKYGLEYLRKGYRNSSFEVEARAAESETSLLDRYDLSAYRQHMPGGQ